MRLPLFPKTHFSILTLICFTFLFTGCAGYQLGNVPYKAMEGVKTIYVPVIKNQTVEPRLPVMMTNAIIRELDNDGTYTSSRLRNADATLEVTIIRFHRDPTRRARDNSLQSVQYRAELTAKATLTNHITGKKLFSDLTVSGKTTFFVQDAAQEAERQAIPLAAKDLAYNLVKQITEGW